jgi:hypothetical protein
MACVARPDQENIAVPETIPVQRYFPLRAGYTWTYTEQVLTPSQTVILQRQVTLTMQYRHNNEHVAHWNFQSGVTALPNVRYRIVEDGIQHAQLTKDTLYTPFIYLLKAPLLVGTTWPVLQGATVCVAAVGALCTVPAGTFQQCVETLQEVEPTPESQVITRLRFAPDVGLVWQQRRLMRSETLERLDTMELQKLPEPVRL